MAFSFARLIALYLPQFHPIPENDAWWGKGFTEWTNTAKARPMFPQHYQPHVPADLGFCDLRVAETRAAQAALAHEYGIEAFCYYHYWFAGRRIIERPFNEVLESGAPDFPFCLCWANQSWTGVWHGAPDRILIEQTYPGIDDHRAHFERALLPAFLDRRYLRIDGKPLLLVYQPRELPHAGKVMRFWRELARAAGLPGLYLVGMQDMDDPQALGFDATTVANLPPRRPWVSRRHPLQWLRSRYREKAGLPTIYRYEDVVGDFWPECSGHAADFPCLIPNWDNTPRSGANGVVLHGSTPELFRRHVRAVAARIRDRPRETNLVFIKSWNEWAEGNHLEPDLRYGRGYLDVLRDEFSCDVGRSADGSR